jgi:hypothetical protein
MDAVLLEPGTIQGLGQVANDENSRFHRSEAN